MMKSSISMLIVLLWAVSSFAQEGVPSEIKEVTLFSNQALVMREASVQTHKGINEILLDIEATRVDRDSISAKVFGEGEILSVQYREIFLKESPREKVRVLESKIDEKLRSKRVLLDNREVMKKKETFLNSVIDFSSTQIPQDMKTAFPSTESMEKTLVFLGSNLQSINESKQTIDFRVKELDKEIRVLKAELASLQRYSQTVKKVIEIVFDSDREQTVDIEATYLVGNAFWSPFYKIDVPLNLGKVDLVMFSKIRQQTGEDWKNVRLSISNVIPLKGVGLPSPRSWYLDIVRPKMLSELKEKVRRFSKMAGAPADKEEDIAAQAPMEEAGFAAAQARELPLSFEYLLPQALNIESRDKETLLPLFSKTLKGEFFYYSVPRMSPLTFLVCKTNADKELLSGPLNVHLGGRFIGKTILREKKPGEEFQLSLGADREVKIKRVKIKDKMKETILGKIERRTVVRELAYKISVENLKSKSIKVKILDSIPVSRTDKIVVKNLSIAPEPRVKDYQDKAGVLEWELNLKPNEKKEILVEFVVTYPKDSPPPGL